MGVLLLKRSGISVLGIVAVLMAVVFVSGCTSSNTTNSSGYKVFENQFVKFNYPDNLTAVDKSTDNVAVELYNGTTSDPANEVGEVGSARSLNKGLISVYSGWTQTTIAGYDAIKGADDTDAGAFIFLNNYTNLGIDFDPAYSSAADTIINSLEIKKVPKLFDSA